MRLDGVRGGGPCERVVPPRRLLLVEDHPINRAMLAHQLGLAGFDVEAEADGERALARFVAGRYAAVVTDLHMPGVDGFRLAAAIRRWERDHGRSRTPIIALTADAPREQVERCLASGIDDCLSKPITNRLLGKKLQRWLPGLSEPRRDESGVRAGVALRDAPVDETALRELAGTDPVRLREFLRRYCDSAADDLRALDEALRARNGSVADIAHRIRGAALMVGAREVASLAEAMEHRARGSADADFAEAARALRRAIARVQNHMRVL